MALTVQAELPASHPDVGLLWLHDPEDAGFKPECVAAVIGSPGFEGCAPRMVRPGVLTHARLTGGEHLEGAAAQAVFDLVKAEQLLKARALAVIEPLLPASMFKPVHDEDGDDTGQVTLKAKHTPVCDFGGADGTIAFTVPGATPELLEALADVLSAAFGDAVSIA